MSKQYRIAIYLRLSKEDEDMMDESNSIINQRMLLHKYVRKKFDQYELTEFVDDGFSGTNFRRPGITDMLEQMRDGRIDCIIVKDFSRFSRDYIELGSYMDQVFPFLGVRFISLNDGYDSADYSGDTMGLDISFKGLLYDLYSKDLSVKVKSSLRTRRENGQYACGNVPFGYAKASNDRHKLVIAENEAEIVRRIFDLALSGKTSMEIAKQFNQERLKTPIEFKNEKKQTSRTPSGENFQWNPAVICSILKNPVYAGDMVYDKTYKNDVGGKNHLKPRSEWKIYKDHHDAIISRRIFDKLQEQRKQTKRKNTKGAALKNPLQGKVYCGGCKKAMSLREGLNPYFRCCQRYVYTDAKKCVSNINLMYLEQIILYKIESELSRKELLEQIKMKKTTEIREKIKGMKKDRDKLLGRKTELQRKRLADYEKSVFDTKHKFQTDNTEIEQAEDMIRDIEYEIDKLEEQVLKRKDEAAAFFNEEGIALTNELVEYFIEKIIVYDEENIEIKWRFGEEEKAVV